MASNPNTELPNRSTFYAARSGGGKSQAVRQNKEIGPRRLIWDPDHDHRATIRETTMTGFIAAVRQNHRKAKWAIAFSGDPTPEAFELFCGAAWAILDGRRQVDVIVEELADCVETTGKAKPKAGQLMRRARKYGGVLHLVTQRPQEIPKTLFRQCARFYIGVQEYGDRRAMAKVADVVEARLADLNELEFWFKEAGKEARRVKFQYKKP